MEDTWRLMVSYIGTVLGLIFYCLPLDIFIRAIQEGSVQGISTTFIVLRVNHCFLFAWYGIPFFSPNNMSMANFNVYGLPFYSFYACVVLHFSSMDLRRKIMIQSNAIIIPFMIFVCCSLYLDATVRHYCCGIVVTSYSLLMHALTTRKTISTVVETRIVDSRTLLMALFMFLNGFSWLVYGALGKDLFVVLSNLVECGGGAILLVIWYCMKNTKQSKPNASRHDQIMLLDGDQDQQ